MWFDTPTKEKPCSQSVVQFWEESVHLSRDSSIEEPFMQLEQQMQEHEREVEYDIERLHVQYILVGTQELSSYLRSHRLLPSLLLELAPHLKPLLGPDIPIRLEIILAGDESPMIRVSFSWKGTIESANAILDAFDEGYWLEHCGKAAGHIVVVYELE
jgi:hypothetical protein